VIFWYLASFGTSWPAWPGIGFVPPVVSTNLSPPHSYPLSFTKIFTSYFFIIHFFQRTASEEIRGIQNPELFLPLFLSVASKILIFPFVRLFFLSPFPHSKGEKKAKKRRVCHRFSLVAKKDKK
jgi:hypothetical protein